MTLKENLRETPPSLLLDECPHVTDLEALLNVHISGDQQDSLQAIFKIHVDLQPTQKRGDFFYLCKTL